MNYNININQKALSELSSDMDIFDAAILIYIKEICSSGNAKIKEKRITNINNDLLTWVDLKTLCTAMPLLRIKARGAITRRIQRIEKNGFIETQQNMIDGHTRLFIRTTNKVDKLTFTDINVDKSTLMDINEHVDGCERASKKHVDEYQPIIDTSNTIHNNTNIPADAPSNTPIKDSLMQQLFEEFWSHYPLKKGKIDAHKSWFNLDPDIALKIIEDIKIRKTTDRQWVKNNGLYIPHPATYLNGRKWEDEITPYQEETPKLALGNKYTKGKMENIREHKF